MKKIALLTAAALLFLMGSCSETELDEKITRLHIIANSDSDEDQVLKLLVRDRIIEQAECASNDECSDESFLSELERCAKETVKEAGYDYNVRAEYTRMYFETREYDGFVIPAGNYNAVRLVIGEGEGRNWWCVLFPPLCTAAASGHIEEEALKAGFTAEEIAVIKGEKDGYVIRFLLPELLNKLLAFFRN